MCFYNMHVYTCFLIQIQEPKNCHQITWEVVMTHDVQEGEFSFFNQTQAMKLTLPFSWMQVLGEHIAYHIV